MYMITAMIVLVIAFILYLLTKSSTVNAGMRKLLGRFMPEKKAQQVMDVTEMSSRTFVNFIVGQLKEALIIGVLCFIGMKLFKMPHAVIISCIITVTALIPMVGAWLGCIVGAIIIAISEPITAIWFVVFIIVLQIVEGNIIYPKVVGKSVGMPGILTFLAITLGSAVFGLPGVLLSVPICAVLYGLFRMFRKKKSDGSEE